MLVCKMAQVVLLTLLTLIASTHGIALIGNNLKIRFGIEIFLGSNYFVEVPTTRSDAISDGYVSIERPDGPYKDLELYVLENNKVLGLFFDPATNAVAGVQIAIPVADYTPGPFDLEAQGFTLWTPRSGEAYWTLQQYFVSNETMSKSRSERAAASRSDAILQEEAVFLTGPGKEIYALPTDEKTIADKTDFTEQACIPLMGTHYYRYVTESMQCNAHTMYPWFPIAFRNIVIGTGFVLVGSLPENPERDWFERPTRANVELIVPRGPQCLYDLVSNYGMITMHIYYVNFPWLINCIL